MNDISEAQIDVARRKISAAVRRFHSTAIVRVERSVGMRTTTFFAYARTSVGGPTSGAQWSITDEQLGKFEDWDAVGKALAGGMAELTEREDPPEVAISSTAKAS